MWKTIYMALLALAKALVPRERLGDYIEEICHTGCNRLGEVIRGANLLLARQFALRMLVADTDGVIAPSDLLLAMNVRLRGEDKGLPKDPISAQAVMAALELCGLSDISPMIITRLHGAAVTGGTLNDFDSEFRRVASLETDHGRIAAMDSAVHGLVAMLPGG